MGLEKIREEIAQKSESAQKAILDEATAKVEQVRKQTLERLKSLEHESMQERKREIAAIEGRENALASMEAKKMVFLARKEVLDSVYKEAIAKLHKMPKKECEQAIKTLLARARKEIDVHTVTVEEADRALVEAPEVRIGPTGGGIICDTKDGAVRVDYTFPTLFLAIKESTTKEASKILFD